MFRPSIAATIGALIIASAPSAYAQSASFTYSPGSHKYRVESSTKVTQEVNGQTIDGELNARHLLSLNISRAGKDTLSLAYTWDSASITTTGPVPSPDMSKVSGTKSSGRASLTGKVFSFDPGTPAAEDLPAMEEFEHFLPVVSAVNRKPGDTWVDTVTVNGNRGGIEVNTTIVVTSTFAGDTTFAGEKSWKIQRNMAFTVAGAGAQQNMAMVIEGTGTGERTDFITSKGVYLGSTTTQTAKSTISLPANNMTIPMTTTVTSKVERVKG
jgi:hypothetical protein